MRINRVWLIVGAISLSLAVASVRAEDPKPDAPAQEKPDKPKVEKDAPPPKKEMSDTDYKRMMEKRAAEEMKKKEMMKDAPPPKKEMSDEEYKRMMMKREEEERRRNEDMRRDGEMRRNEEMRREEDRRREEEGRREEEMRRMMMSRELRIFAVEYNDSSKLANILKPMLPPGSYVAADEHSNKLIVLTPGEGLHLAEMVVRELDVPAHPRHPMGEPRAMRPDEGRMPRFDYQRGPDQPQRPDFRPDAPRREMERESERPRAQRSEGTLLRKSDGQIVIQPRDWEHPLELAIPTVKSESGEWRPKGAVLERLAKIEIGDSVVVEWFEAEGTRYVEGVAPLRKEGEMKETFILERDKPKGGEPKKDAPDKKAEKKPDDPDASKPEKRDAPKPDKPDAPKSEK